MLVWDGAGMWAFECALRTTYCGCGWVGEWMCGGGSDGCWGLVSDRLQGMLIILGTVVVDCCPQVWWPHRATHVGGWCCWEWCGWFVLVPQDENSRFVCARLLPVFGLFFCPLSPLPRWCGRTAQHRIAVLFVQLDRVAWYEPGAAAPGYRPRVWPAPCVHTIPHHTPDCSLVTGLDRHRHT